MPMWQLRHYILERARVMAHRQLRAIEVATLPHLAKARDRRKVMGRLERLAQSLRPGRDAEGREVLVGASAVLSWLRSHGMDGVFE